MIKRYDIVRLSDTEVEMHERKNGPWIKFEDVFLILEDNKLKANLSGYYGQRSDFAYTAYIVIALLNGSGNSDIMSLSATKEGKQRAFQKVINLLINQFRGEFTIDTSNDKPWSITCGTRTVRFMSSDERHDN